MTDLRDAASRYGLGKLTVEETRPLLEAALEDQELFDALCEEQAQRDLVAQVGARSRLIAGLGPERFASRVTMVAAAAIVLSTAAALGLLALGVAPSVPPSDTQGGVRFEADSSGAPPR